jgi:hypothetical protein
MFAVGEDMGRMIAAAVQARAIFMDRETDAVPKTITGREERKRANGRTS